MLMEGSKRKTSFRLKNGLPCIKGRAAFRSEAALLARFCVLSGHKASERTLNYI